MAEKSKFLGWGKRFYSFNVGKVTGYGLDGREIEVSRLGQEILLF
jgi:hypothetical protein